MDTKRFRSLCANVDGLSVGQLRELRRKLGELDARREVLARVDARGQALKACIHCGAAALVRWGSTRTDLQRLREPRAAGAPSLRQPARRWPGCACPRSCTPRSRTCWRRCPARAASSRRGSRWQIPVLTLADRAGGRHAERLPDRRAESLIARLEARVRRDAVLCSDGDGAYRLFAEAHRLPHYRVNAKRGPRVIERAFHIQTVNNLHRRLNAFMCPFCGPATKHLHAYLAWFIARFAASQTALDDAWRRLLAV